MVITGRSLLPVIFLTIGLRGQAQYQLSADTIRSSAKYGLFSVNGDFPEHWYQVKNSGFFKSYISVKVKGSSIPILGDHTLSTNKLTFKPRFLVDPHVLYEVTFFSPYSDTLFLSTINFPGSSDLTHLLFTSPKDTIPANILRMYLKFDKPMGLQNPFDFIQLRTEDGEVIKDAFVEYKEGLWNNDRTRLTLLFHPGRIKQGVGPNSVQGPILFTGKKYYLTISDAWQDQNGNHLNQIDPIPLDITKEIRTKVNPASWKIVTPTQPLNSLLIYGDRIMDEEIFDKVQLQKDGGNILGQWSVDGTKYSFQNKAPWKSGKYLLIIPSKIEDVSGNTLASAFDSVEKMKIDGVDNKVLIFHVE